MRILSKKKQREKFLKKQTGKHNLYKTTKDTHRATSARHFFFKFLCSEIIE
jgi:hypothetical protein